MDIVEDFKPPQHAICSASGAERWLNCPGSIALSLPLPQPESSVYAQEGTRAHAHAESLLRAWESNGRKVRDEDIRAVEDSMLPEDRADGMLDHVMTYVNLCLDEVEQFEAPPVVRIEQKLTLDKGMAMFGTADFVCIGERDGKRIGVIVDLKYGKGKKVQTQENPQLSYYAVALRKSFKKPIAAVKMRVVQPRISEFYSEQWYSEEDLKRWDETLILGAEKALWMVAKAKPLELKVGGWCWFCPAKDVCQEYNRKRDSELIEMFGDEK